MTTSPKNSSADITDFKVEFADLLALSMDGQEMLFRSARTANTFTDEMVSDEQVKAIYDLAKWAPTSMNNQPLRIVLVRSPQARDRLVQTMTRGNKSKTATAPLVAVLAADHAFHENFPTTFPHFPGARNMFADDDALRAHTAELNATLQFAYFMLAVRAAGLAAGPMTGFDANALNEAFFPDGEHKVLAVVNIGKAGPDAWIDRLPRLDFEGSSARLTRCLGDGGPSASGPGLGHRRTLRLASMVLSDNNAPHRRAAQHGRRQAC